MFSAECSISRTSRIKVLNQIQFSAPVASRCLASTGQIPAYGNDRRTIGAWRTCKALSLRVLKTPDDIPNDVDAHVIVQRVDFVE
jgi:hypothetical protein